VTEQGYTSPFVLRRLLLVGALGAVAGCGSGDGGDTPARQTRTGPATPNITADGRLDRAASPLTIAAIEKLPSNSVQETIMTLWFYAQWGASPNIVAMYDPRARTALGSSRIASAYSQARPEVLAAVPRIVGRRRIATRTLVLVDVLSKDAPPSHESFLLVKRFGSWRVLHDSFLERNIVPVVRSEVQLRVAPRATKSVGEAELAGSRAAARYREVAIR
jgi:hypothetical protein